MKAHTHTDTHMHMLVRTQEAAQRTLAPPDPPGAASSPAATVWDSACVLLNRRGVADEGSA